MCRSRFKRGTDHRDTEGAPGGARNDGAAGLSSLPPGKSLVTLNPGLALFLPRVLNGME